MSTMTRSRDGRRAGSIVRGLSTTLRSDDRRYHFACCFTGRAEPRWLAFFDGEQVGRSSHATLAAARFAARTFDAARSVV